MSYMSEKLRTLASWFGRTVEPSVQTKSGHPYRTITRMSEEDILPPDHYCIFVDYAKITNELAAIGIPYPENALCEGGKTSGDKIFYMRRIYRRQDIHKIWWDIVPEMDKRGYRLATYVEYRAFLKEFHCVQRNFYIGASSTREHEGGATENSISVYPCGIGRRIFGSYWLELRCPEERLLFVRKDS